MKMIKTMNSYHNYFGMTRDPFSKGRGTGVVVETQEYGEALYRLDYLKELRGFGVLTGPPGIGKTTVLRCWSRTLPQSSYKVIYMNITSVTACDFYRDMARQFGLETSFRKIENIRNIQKEIRRLTEEKALTPVIIIDEAADLGSFTLDDMKSVFSFDMDSRNRAIIVFSGLPTFTTMLNMNRFEPLRQRLVMNWTIEPLSPEAVSEYILQKVRSAKGSDELFTADAITAVSNASGGVPRVIDQICTRSLILAEQSKEEYINQNTIRSAVEDLQLR